MIYGLYGNAMRANTWSGRYSFARVGGREARHSINARERH